MKCHYGLVDLLSGQEFCKTNSKDGKDGKDGKDDNMMTMLKNSLFMAAEEHE